MALPAVLVGIAGWLALGLIGMVRRQDAARVGHVLFPLSALISLTIAAAGFAGLGADPGVLVLPLGLPGLPFHIRLDALSSFFLMLIGAASAGISIYSAGYFRQGDGISPGTVCIVYHVFLAAMAVVVLADDAYLFMVAWETMALSSYFLVTSNHRVAAVRSAGFLYLLLAHIGAIGVLLSFGVMQGSGVPSTAAAVGTVFGSGYTFDAMRGRTPGCPKRTPPPLRRSRR